MLFLAARREEGYVSIPEVADALGISHHFLTKVLQKLTAARLLESNRGPGGGIALARPVSRISLLDVVQAIEDRDLFTTCVLGLAGCGERSPCPLHERWSGERRRIEEMFRSARLDNLSGPIAEGLLRLTD